METAQVRLPKTLVNQLNSLVEEGFYTSKSDVIRDAIRKLIWEKQVGSIPNTGDSVKEIREIRKKLSEQELDLDEINGLGE